MCGRKFDIERIEQLHGFRLHTQKTSPIFQEIVIEEAKHEIKTNCAYNSCQLSANCGVASTHTIVVQHR